MLDEKVKKHTSNAYMSHLGVLVFQKFIAIERIFSDETLNILIIDTKNHITW